MSRDIVLFGAGECGKRALAYYGKDKVKAFIDNDPGKTGTYIDEIPVISLEQLMGDEKLIIATSDKYIKEIFEQLEREKIIVDGIFKDKLLPTDQLVINKYQDPTQKDMSEEEWNRKQLIELSNYQNNMKFLDLDCPQIREIEIETVNRCNGKCSFCPINRDVDPRKTTIMDAKLFKKIIDNLSDMNYMGRIALFSNNEPLIDKRIVEFIRYTRKKLPNANIHIFTNGTLLSVELFQAMVDYIDELIIDNYSDDLELIEPVKIVKEFIESTRSDLAKKVTISLRKENEILTSRGGEARNRNQVVDVGECSCALPFCQMVIRPTGEVSLCCNDPIGKYTLGDLRIQTIQEVWNGDLYDAIRKQIKKGRKNLPKCSKCDTFISF